MVSFFRKKGDGDTVKIDIASSTVIRVMLVVAVSMVLFSALHKASHAITLIFTAFFLSLALNAPVHWLASKLPGKRRGNRSTATIISFVFVILLLLGFLASIVPPMVKQTSNFISAAPKIITEVRDQNSQVGRLIRKYRLEGQVDNFSKQLSARLKNSSGAALGTVSRIGSSIFSVLTILVLTFMMLIEGPRWLRTVEDIIPDELQPRTRRMAADMYDVIKGYVNGQVILAAIASVLIFPAMIVLHVDYAIALVVVVFICGLIPLVGHTLGAIIVTAVALVHSPVSAVIILGYYILYQQIENYVVQPKIQANSTNMSPLLVFSSVVIGVSFGGLFGGLVAIPLAGCLRIFLLDYLKSKKILSPDQGV